MDVRCDRCQTEYEFDEARLTETGVAVKCTACGNVFKVRKPVTASAPIPLERPREWKVRREGQVYALKDLPELQRWIVERRVARDDEVSLSGEAWRKLGSMPELASFFEVVEAAEQAQRMAAAQPAAHTTAPTLISAPAIPPTPAQAQGSASWEGTPQAFTPATHAVEPAWTASPSISAVDDDLDADELRHVRPSRWPLFLIVLALLGAGGGAVYYFVLRPQLKPGAPTGAVAASGPTAAPAATGSSGPATAQAAPIAPAKPPAPPTPAPTAKPSPTPPPNPTEAAPAHPKPEVAQAKPADAPPANQKPAPKADSPAPAGHDFNWYLSKGHRLLDSRPKEALAMFDQAAQVNPGSPEPDSGRGIAYSNMEQWPKAIAAFEAALKKSPEFTEAVMGLAEAHRYKGDKHAALLYYKRYLQLTPDGPDAPAAKAQIENLQGE